MAGTSHISGGKLLPGRPRGSWRNLAFGGTAVLLVGILAGSLLSGGDPDSRPSCVEGRLLIEGSSAFAPVMEEIGRAYQAQCAATEIRVDGNGSGQGVRSLLDHGQEDPSRLAVSDGPAPNKREPLVEHPVGVVIFAVFVNRGTGIHELSVDQLRGIHSGSYTNWKQLGGNDQKISIVSRDSESGTRRTFESQVLKTPEKALSSDDCETKNRDPESPVIRCEMRTTTQLLDEVRSTPGAIGYAELSNAARYTDVHRIQVDGADADIESIKQRRYPFWTVEYLYTYGTPESSTALSAFLAYLDADAAKNILRSHGHVPCVDRQEDLTKTLCG